MTQTAHICIHTLFLCSKLCVLLAQPVNISINISDKVCHVGQVTTAHLTLESFDQTIFIEENGYEIQLLIDNPSVASILSDDIILIDQIDQPSDQYTITISCLSEGRYELTATLSPAPYVYSAPAQEAKSGQDEKQNCKVEIICKEPDPCKDICYRCTGIARNKSFKLKGDADPKGGKYLWERLDGADVFKLSNNTNEVTDVKLNKKAEHVDTIRVKLSYTVHEQTCLDTHTVVIRRPASLRVIDQWLYVNNNGNITVQHNGAASGIQAMSEDQQGIIQRVVRAMQDNYIGVARLVYYEVLDQHGERWSCNGRLEEQITPMREGLIIGGVDIEAGQPKNPDHLFYVNHQNKFKEFDLDQKITVDGCLVRYNQIAFSITGVTLTEMDTNDKPK